MPDADRFAEIAQQAHPLSKDSLAPDSPLPIDPHDLPAAPRHLDRSVAPGYTLPNVVLTPHIAGAHGTAESLRLGRYAVDEIARYVAGQPLRWQVTREQAPRLA